MIRVFKRVDVAKDKQIDFTEFQNALHHVGIYVDTSIERECFEEMDRDKSGTLNMDEFIISLRVNKRHIVRMNVFEKLLLHFSRP